MKICIYLIDSKYVFLVIIVKYLLPFIIVVPYLETLAVYSLHLFSTFCHEFVLKVTSDIYISFTHSENLHPSSHCQILQAIIA